MIGATIDHRYRILRRLGEGGMGAVFEAEHTGTGRCVAIKVIHTERAHKPDMIARFQREARAAGAIDTPHIVQVLDTGTDPDSAVIYTAMELLRGEDLRQVLQRVHRLPPPVALRLAGQACLGLAGAHGAGVIHRDIKPANIFLCQKGNDEISVKIVDFGIAKIKADMLPQEDMALTTTGGMIGSPLYMSPEQALGAKTIDHRSDLWSLGVVLYETIAGRLPHVSETLGSLIVAISTKDVPPLRELAPWVPAEVARLVHRLLERDPEARFPTALALLDAIRRLAPEGLGVRSPEIIAVSDEERAQAAPGDPVALDTDARSKLALTGTVEIAPSEVTTDPRGRGLAAAGHASSGDNGLAVSQLAGAARPAAPRSRLLPLVAATAVLVSGALGVALYRAPSGGVAPGVNSAVAATAALSAAAPVPATAAAPAERVVRVGVGPAEVSVEVDGEAAPVADGSVEVRGTLGSIHRVRLAVGPREVTQTVVITEEGPLPLSVRLELPPASATALADPPPPAPPAPRPPPQPPGPPKPPGTTGTALGARDLQPAPTFE